jgi:hypothetical protein
VQAPAAVIKWLSSGVAIAAEEPSLLVGEFELVNLKTAIGTEANVLCSFDFSGAVGPGGEDHIIEALTLTGVIVTLTKLLTCVNGGGCTNPQVSPENLPWLTELELMGTEAEPLFLDRFLTSGAGNPAWSIKCEVVGLPFEETCTGETSMDVINDAGENDVLGVFSAEMTFFCGGQTMPTALILNGAADEEMLLTLTSGLALAVSYE